LARAAAFHLRLSGLALTRARLAFATTQEGDCEQCDEPDTWKRTSSHAAGRCIMAHFRRACTRRRIHF
jgi:hypothetical protein